MRREIGYLPENVALYPEMRVEEYLAYRAPARGDAAHAPAGAWPRRSTAACSPTCGGRSSAPCRRGTASASGSPARSSTTPSVLVLDEPTVGLDPKQIIAIRELIRELGREHTLLLSTHILPEVELLCERVLIIDRGRIVAEGRPEQLRERWLGAPAVTVEFEGDPAEAAEALAAVPGVTARASARRRVPAATLLEGDRSATRARRSSAWRSSAAGCCVELADGAGLARGHLRAPD